MRIAVCDDERAVRELYTDKIRQLYPDADLIRYQSGEELLQDDRRPDILLLDIQMPGRNGMETARQLRRDSREMVIIFVSALEEFVFQAFDVGAFHYLVKPFDDRKFAQVLSRAVSQYEENSRQKAARDEEKSAPSIMITKGGEHITVRIADIVYAEVFDRKVILHTMDSDIEYYGKMKELEKAAGSDFYRPHRAYLVNFHFIRKYDAATIYLERGQALMAKQNYHDFVKSYLRFNQRKA